METRNLTDEEFEALNKDMNEILMKHNCDLTVVAKIHITKRVDGEPESTIQTKEIN